MLPSLPRASSPRPTRQRSRAALTRWGLAAALLLGGASASPATTLFQAASQALLQGYYGWSQADRPALVAQYRQTLDAACAPVQEACSFDQGRKVIAEMLGKLNDPHTNIRDADGAERLREIQQDLTVPRSGLQVIKTGLGLLVVGVLPGSPGAAVGVQRFDLLTEVNGEQAGTDKAVDAAGFVRRERQAAPLLLQLTRAGQALPPLMLTPQPMKASDVPTLSWQQGPAGRVAVIQYPTFLSSNSAALFLSTLHDAQAQGAVGLVIDLRYNGGGRLDQCVQAASAFRPVVYQAHWSNTNWEYAALDGDSSSAAAARQAPGEEGLWHGPAVLLVGPNTASCAEVFGYFAHLSGALVVGEPTKGVMNSGVSFFPLPDQGVMSVTILRAYDAAGQPLPPRLQPDVSAPTDVAALTSTGQDSALSAALQTVERQPFGAGGLTGK
ncbi:S41 family peptidase [Deinococcus sp.]|uniref:S41 family peptidase n=1 Tax=Deinococcus sp. TaxID=47478 RepID=UPI003CC68E63